MTRYAAFDCGGGKYCSKRSGPVPGYDSALPPGFHWNSTDEGFQDHPCDVYGKQAIRETIRRKHLSWSDCKLPAGDIKNPKGEKTMSEGKKITEQEVEKLGKEQLSEVTDGTAPIILSPYRCKKCGLEIGAATAKQNDG